jgi:hypothetical protein
MQDIIKHIFDELGGPTAIANGTGFAVQTVHDWLRKAPAEIPPWRRSAVLQFAKDQGKLASLSREALAYLESSERTVRQAAA